MLPESASSSWTVLVFLGYMVVVYGLAFAAHRISQGRSFIKEYYLGSRGLGAWTLALTFAATSASGGSFTGFPSLIYTYGWVMALWIAGYMIFPLCAMGIFGKRLNQVARRSDAVTLPDIFRDRYERPWLGMLTTVLLVFFLVVYLVAQFKAGGVLMQTLMADVPLFQATSGHLDGLAAQFDGVSSGYLAGLFGFAAAVVCYTAYGGFRAVVLTDVMQGIVMGLGVIVLLPLALYAAYVYLAPVDPRDAVPPEPYAGREAREAEPFHLGQLSEGLDKASAHLRRTDPAALTAPGAQVVNSAQGETITPFLPLGMAISFFFLWPIAAAGQPGNMLRLMAFKDSKSLARAIFTVTIYYSAIYLPLVVIFVCAKTLPLDLEQSDQAMPAMALFAAPPWLAGIIIAAPFAAVMSTVDSFLLMISSALVRDIYMRNFNADLSERVVKRASLASTVAVGLLVTMLAVNPPRFLQDLIIFGSAGQAATFLAAMALTLYWPRSNAPGTACAMISGFVAVAGLYTIGRLQTGVFQPWTPLGLHPFIWGLVASFAGGIAGTLASAPPSRELVLKYFVKKGTGKSQS